MERVRAVENKWLFDVAAYGMATGEGRDDMKRFYDEKLELKKQSGFSKKEDLLKLLQRGL